MCPILPALVRAVIYARSGSEMQNAPSAKVDEQLRRLRQHALERSYVIVGEASDASQPGTTLSRPGLANVMSGAAAILRTFDLVLTTNGARLARNPMLLKEITSFLNGAGIKIEYADEADLGPLAGGDRQELPRKDRVEDHLRRLGGLGEDD
ncbi:recombinase family protein [Rhizobium leguminosarum]|uniref:recombinase family protein n=1 Tax=Rhizobium leguminosarum TaxID=384 RepID=UPI00102FEFBF|nr:recombinase family protein [Rhizobium leguminosarum]TAY32394.1 recombinase family protein [Rhizobium leguminosarum]